MELEVGMSDLPAVKNGTVLAPDEIRQQLATITEATDIRKAINQYDAWVAALEAVGTNTALLIDAVYGAVEARCRAVEIYDALEDAEGNRYSRSETQVSDLESAKQKARAELGKSHTTINNWRKVKNRIPADERLEMYFAAKERMDERFSLQVYLKTAKGYPLTAANHAASDDPDYDGDEWFTPIVVIEAARAVMGAIDLDPASNAEANEVVKAEMYYSKEDDSLTEGLEWHGRVWLNPPYSGVLIRQFVAKLIAQYEAGNVTEAIILTNNSSDTGWFHDLLSRYPACFTRGRIQFWRPDSDAFGARQGQTLFYLGNDFDAFRFVFSEIGQVVVKA